jgi:hypothetical protein
MKILDRKNAINRRQDEKLIIVLTAIHRVCCLNRTVLKCHRLVNWTKFLFVITRLRSLNLLCLNQSPVSVKKFQVSDSSSPRSRDF